MDLYDLHAANTPDKAAVIFEDRTITWSEFAELTRKSANALIQWGFQEGERAATFSFNSASLVVFMSGVRSANGVVIPVNWHLTEAELTYILRDSEPVIVFTDSDHLSTAAAAARGCPVREVVDTPNFDAMVEGSSAEPPSRSGSFFGSYMLYTSGTSGRPKAAYHASSPDASVGAAYVEAFDLSWQDVHLVAGPLYHSAPAAFCGIALSIGATAVVMPHFDPEEVLRLIDRHNVTTTFVAPTLLRRILDLPQDLFDSYESSSLRSLIVAGAPCPHDLKVRTQDRFGEVLYEFYGSTETKAALFMQPRDQLRKPGSCGTPFPGVEVKVAAEDGTEMGQGQVGEIWVRKNPATFDGYHGDPEKTAETIKRDWIRTGDLAYVDPDGFFYIVDRITDMVISGGVNIYPAEVEAALQEHPAVSDSAVFGIPDEEWGERLHAIVEASADDLQEGELEQFLRTKLAGFKVPRSWEVVESLPRTDDGKLRKRTLREPFWRQRHGPV